MRPRFLDIDSSSDVRQDHEICNDGSELSNLAKEVLMTVFQSWGLDYSAKSRGLK